MLYKPKSIFLAIVISVFIIVSFTLNGWGRLEHSTAAEFEENVREVSETV